MAPRWLQDGLKVPKDGPKMPQDRSKNEHLSAAKRSFLTFDNSHSFIIFNMLQDASKMLQDSPKMANDR